MQRQHMLQGEAPPQQTELPVECLCSVPGMQHVPKPLLCGVHLH
jgi:hypothetical protein